MISDIIFLIQTLLVRIGNKQWIIDLFVYLISMWTVEKCKQMYEVASVMSSYQLHDIKLIMSQ